MEYLFKKEDSVTAKNPPSIIASNVSNVVLSTRGTRIIGTVLYTNNMDPHWFPDPVFLVNVDPDSGL